VYGFARGSFERRDGATVLTRQAARYPLHLLEPRRPDGYRGALLYLAMVAGGVQSGDCLDVELHLADGAQALVTTQSATKILTMSSGQASQRNTFVLGENALLEYLPDEIIPFADSRFSQATHVEMAPTAVLILAEVLTPGRVARSEYFAFGEYTSRVAVQRKGRLVLREAAVLEPTSMRLDGPALLGGHPYYATLTVLAPLADAALADQLHSALSARDGILGSASAGPERVVARLLGTSLERTRAALHAAWRLARLHVVGQSLSHVPGKIVF
jgi:urease accessory protein